MSWPDSSAALLRRVRRRARSLYPTLRILPAPLAREAALGYAIAREADDVVDNPARPAAQRLALLARLRAQPIPEGLAPTLGVIFDEMERELRAGGARTPDELDAHLYGAGGVVGEFLADRFAAMRPRVAASAAARMRQEARALGMALELVNVLRDRAVDARAGRRYEGPTVERALDLLRQGWRYVCALPHAEWRLRWACAWPALIAEETLRLIRHRPGGRIPRRRVYQIMARTVLAWLLGPAAFSRLPRWTSNR